MRFTPNPRYAVKAATPYERQRALSGLLSAVAARHDVIARRDGCKSAQDFVSWAAARAASQ